MRDLYDRPCIRVTVVLSIVVAVAGFPAFQRMKGFPSSPLQAAFTAEELENE